MNLGVQYYRAPFPEAKHWADDLKKIKDSGLNTVQLWVLWAWVESSPDKFDFADYDCIVELADKNGLGVILSTIAEIQPPWIHRLVPGSEMLDHMGHKVISSNRGECHFGITPGGCTDHPGIWERMEIFLRRTASRYHTLPNLRGWDAWNELRWNVNADGIVCFCPHTLRNFRAWLAEKYGGLQGLNRAWKRRYADWEDVLPGKLPDRPYTEMMAFEHFITCRANQHAIDRCNVIKSVDKTHPVTVHGGAPTPLYSGSGDMYALDRGNDWFFADSIDGIGCSSFPVMAEPIDDADFGMRIEFVKSAANGKKVWLSEIQGGRAALGFKIYANVEPAAQQRWIWNGLACGADTFLFWCWRDEVFGRESAGFGLNGNDGLEEARLAAMRTTAKLFNENHDLISSYKPNDPEVGILFSPQSYYLHWAQEASAGKAAKAIMGYARALARRSIPYRFIEEEHLGGLDKFKLIFAPRCIVLDDDKAEIFAQYLNHGGILFCESEFGAFDSRGLYRYPDERFLARAYGIQEAGRRNLSAQTLTVKHYGSTFELDIAQWLTPLTQAGMKVLAENEYGPLIAEYKCGNGKVISCGTYLGDMYYERREADFEAFLAAIVKTARISQPIDIVSPAPAADAFLYLKTGQCATGDMAFVFFPETSGEASLNFSENIFPGDKVIDLLSGHEFAIKASGNKRSCTVKPSHFNIAVLCGKLKANKDR